MSKSLKGACVGAGYFSRFQYEAWARIPEVEIVSAAGTAARQYCQPGGN